MVITNNLYALILAGGSGTRLWPKSIKKSPKHLLKLYTDQSMIKETVDRLEGIVPHENIFVVTKADQAADIKRELPFINPKHVIAEPTGKNTAWAMGLGAYYIAHENSDAVVVNLAADHVIERKDVFQQTVLAAAETARLGDYLLTIGIVPTMPHTGYGYIKIGEAFQEVSGMQVYNVDGFQEKPDLETAKDFLPTGQYFWNANLYTWHVNALKTALHVHAGHVAEGLDRIASVIDTNSEQTVMNEVYTAAQEAQIDAAVSEKATNLLMIKGDFGWNDIGDWGVLFDIKAKDEQNNVVIDDGLHVINIGSSNSLIESHGRMIATIGLDNIVVIDTPNATLICAQDKVQDVKKVVEKLKADNRSEFL